jgi:hypothetical protein
MRATRMTLLILAVLPFAMPPAGSEESTAADVVTASAAKAAEDREFEPPPGFRTRKRGKFTLYCRKEPVMGTRFPAEKCYDETGIREMLRAQLEDQEKVDQMRRICGNLQACGGG